MDHRINKLGFTLIELLVVIAILAILISVLVPSLRAAKAAAQRTYCASNMRQIGTVIQMYADNNRGYFPETTHNQVVQKSWIYTLTPYIQEIDSVRICPADPKRKERLKEKLTSYILNEYIAVPNIDPFGRMLKSYTNLHKLRITSKTIVAFEGADDMSVDATSDHTHSRQWFTIPDGNAWDRICSDIQPDRHRARMAAPDKTMGSANYLYADSHVDRIDAGNLKELADDEFNFAKPPD